ncbi:hemagglutinin-neuraminidase [avian paramyxovirus 7]|uniref:Hemagglutinin-neuraminidase n=1 Tax=avian paramyxovirus 7 TaxID=2560317 RepID=C6FGZ0_9MONO|nr:hemagglutinin-neuraminidase [Avian metaavulavirus 7]ACN72644.1 hemagglutinin-neuraminidase [Avian metaavulavirus 7]
MESIGKGTWRTVYRVLTILLDVVIIILSVIALISLGLKPGERIINEVNGSIHNQLVPLSGITSDIQAKVSSIYRSNLLSIPLQLDQINQAISSSARQIADTINSFLALNGSGTFIYTNSPEFANGFNRAMFPTLNQSLNMLTPGNLIEFTNFIPTPTTKSGCIRIPSFSMSSSHWCYTHNIIASGCQDHSTSSEYISMGVVEVTDQAYPNFRTTLSITLADNLNRKSCSIAATGFGCDILCSVVTETENDDYQSPEPTQMIYGRLFFNGTYSEMSLNVNQMFADWVANYPAVGSGVELADFVIFPLYGGVKITSTLGASLSQYYYIPKVPTVNCSETDAQQIEKAKASYSPPKVAPNIWAQAVVRCNKSVNLANSCEILTFNTSTMMMGAEGRLLMIGKNVYFYQRSSSYWPVGIIYKLDLQELTTFSSNQLLSTIPIPFEKFPRPASTAGVCSKPNVCPAVCQTGVYQDLWVLYDLGKLENTTAVGLYLNSAVGRMNPFIGIANTLSWYNTTRLFAQGTPASYSTTTCFKNTKIDTAYCLSILELSDSLLGSWRITPLLYNITLSIMS